MGILEPMKRRLLNRKVAFLGTTTLATAAVMATPAAAQDFTPITTMLTTVGAALTGPVGRGIGLIAIMVVGYSGFTGRINWGFALSVVIGLVLVFGAAAILSGF